MESPKTSVDPKGAGEPGHDIFLSYNSEDLALVEVIAGALDDRGLRVWFDQWQIAAGDPVREGLERALPSCKSCAVFIGPHGMGKWQREEISLALSRRMAAPEQFRVFAVVLPAAPTDVGDFLHNYHRVTFRSLDDQDALEQLIGGIRGIAPGRRRRTPVEKGECPYRGLEKFDVDDAPYFFGREQQVQELLARMRQGYRFIAIAGSSGSGKSSLARAGVLAALDKDAVILRPQSEPLRRLAVALAPHFQYKDHDVDYLTCKLGRNASALREALDLGLSTAPAGHRLPLLVDQFEELFTLCPDEAQRKAFVSNLCDAAVHPEGRAVVVVTLRADFYGRCAAYPDLRQALSGHCLLGAMSRDELRRAVAEPARRVGWSVDERLLDLLWSDFERQPPGCLPLLQYALWEMWQRATSPKLDADLYLEIGGLEGALGRRASQVFYEQFSPEQREICRRVLLRLTEPTEGRTDVRLRLPIEHILPTSGDATAVETVVEKLAAERLLTLDKRKDGASERIVEIAHEALLTSWEELRGWLADRRDERRTYARLSSAARQWEDNRRGPDFLLTGTRLTDAEEWAKSQESDLNRLEQELLRTSLAARDRRKRIKAAVVAAITGLALVASGLAFVAWRQFRSATAEGQFAVARELAVRSGQLVETDPERALLLSLEGLRRAREQAGGRSLPEAETVLRKVLARSGGTAVGFRGERILTAAVRPEGIHLLSLDRQGTPIWRQWSFDGRPQDPPLGLPGKGALGDAGFSPDGKWLATYREGEDLWLIGLAPRTRRPLPGTEQATSFAFSPDSRWLATDAYGEIRIWDPRASFRHRFSCPAPASSSLDFLFFDWETGSLRGLDQEKVYTWSLSEDGCHLLGSGANSWSSDNFRLGRPEIRLPESWYIRNPVGYALDLERKWLVVWPEGGRARLWDMTEKDPVAGPEPVLTNAHRDAVQFLNPTASGFWLFPPQGTLAALSLSCRGSTEIPQAVLGSDRRWLLGWSPQGFCLWDLASDQKEGGKIELPGESGPIDRAAVGPEGRWLATARARHPPRAWERKGGRYVAISLPALPLGATGAPAMAFSPLADRPWLAATWPDGSSRIWNLGALLHQPIEMAGVPGTVSHLVSSPDGRWVAKLAVDGRIQLKDLEAPSSPSIAPEEDGVLALAFSPDSRHLVTGSTDVVLWRWQDGKGGAPELVREHTLRGHKESVRALAFSDPKHKRLASASDGTVRLWDLDENSPDLSGVALPSPSPNPSSPSASSIRVLSFAPDGRHLLGGALGGEVWLWSLEVRKLEELACKKLGRNLSRQEWREATARDEAPPETCPGLPHPLHE